MSSLVAAPARLQEDRARLRALALLARRDRSERELRSTLGRDGFEPDTIEATLERLRREHAVDDAALAARFARSRMAGKALGRHRIRQELRRRGLDREIIEGGVAAALEEVSEAGTLEALAERYWRTHARVPRALRLRKLCAFLLRRGFPRGLVAARIEAIRRRERQAARDGDAGQEGLAGGGKADRS